MYLWNIWTDGRTDGQRTKDKGPLRYKTAEKEETCALRAYAYRLSNDRRFEEIYTVTWSMRGCRCFCSVVLNVVRSMYRHTLTNQESTKEITHNKRLLERHNAPREWDSADGTKDSNFENSTRTGSILHLTIETTHRKAIRREVILRTKKTDGKRLSVLRERERNELLSSEGGAP